MFRNLFIRLSYPFLESKSGQPPKEPQYIVEKIQTGSQRERGIKGEFHREDYLEYCPFHNKFLFSI